MQATTSCSLRGPALQHVVRLAQIYTESLVPILCPSGSAHKRPQGATLLLGLCPGSHVGCASARPVAGIGSFYPFLPGVIQFSLPRRGKIAIAIETILQDSLYPAVFLRF